MRIVQVFLAIAILLQLVGVIDHSLWSPDEPRVAEIAREMAVSGDYIIPHFSGRPFLEKPPLYFATVGVFYRVFGTTCEGVGRFASVIFAIGTLLVVFFGTRAIYTGQIAALSTLVLATSFKFFEISHKMVVDIALCFFITTALFSFILAYKDKSSWGYRLFWISLALAFMAKGLIGIGIPLAVVILFALWQEDFFLINPHERSTLTTKDENMLGPRETSVPEDWPLIPCPYFCRDNQRRGLAVCSGPAEQGRCRAKGTYGIKRKVYYEG